ncbi:MAG: sulfite oxidase-like oxidoreductase [Acidimicrobiia bacterium]|nr:sulfite oxidase-like oxidoreductase [Acidimicrobiia bacterium]
MGFFDRNREDLLRRGYSPDRLPPGQYFTDRFPVLHVGDVPASDLSTWDLRLFGAVAQERRLSWDELRALPETSVECDIHCVTKWTKLDTRWSGVRFRDVMALVDVDPAADTVIAHAEGDYTANVPLAVMLDDDVVLASGYDGAPLAAEHGGPLRLLVPKRYFWKSAKWLRGLEWRIGDAPGFWERNGYHNDAKPFLEQRYWGD